MSTDLEGHLHPKPLGLESGINQGFERPMVAHEPELMISYLLAGASGWY